MNSSNKGLGFLLALIFPVVFNIIFFVCGGTQHPASVWISYGFIHFAYFLAVIAPYLVPNSKDKFVMGVPLAGIAWGYFCAAFVLGLIFILAKPESYKTAFVVQLIPAAVCAALMLIQMMGNNSTAQSMQRHQTERQFIAGASAQLGIIRNSVSDPAIRKQIESVYDLIRSSPQRSSASVAVNENAVMEQISALQAAVSAQDPEKIRAAVSSIRQQTELRNSFLNMNQ